MRSNASTNDFVRLYLDGLETGSAGLPASLGDQGGPSSREVYTAEEVLSIEELAQRFSVSTKTISRWREHGLVAQRYVVDGRRRVGFLASAVERFVRSNPLRV